VRGQVVYLSSTEANEFIMPRHYSGRKPNISEAFGWIIDGELKAVVTYGKPANNALCEGICGKEYSPNVYELSRLVRLEGFEEQLSQFVAATLRRVSANDWIIVSYADAGVGHNGYIYQATNFLYTGKTKERLQFHTPGKHSRHGSVDSKFREIRTAKHRYVFFATKNKNLRKAWGAALTYSIEPYPKEKNNNYELGTVFNPTVVDVSSDKRIVSTAKFTKSN